LAIRDGAHCVVCREQGSLRIHHIDPLCYGGANDIDNLVLLCGKCHVEEHKEDEML